MRPGADPAAIGRELGPHRVRAHNFAAASANKIHSDEVASKLGYRGGLVPGVSLFAYMTVPVVREFGAEWIAHGAMTGKFIQPIYDGEDTTVRARIISDSPLRIELNLLNEQGELCAVGVAEGPRQQPPADAAKYPRHPMPAAKLPARVDALLAGTPLGSLQIDANRSAYGGEFVGLLEELRESLPLYRAENAPWHPALMPMRANRLLAENVDLGPWIHTASEVHFHALPERGEEVWLCGRIADSFVKRGHEIAVLDLAALGKNGRVLARILHTAIVRPAQISTQ
jgi:hypothetical protein